MFAFGGRILERMCAKMGATTKATLSYTGGTKWQKEECFLS